MNNDKMQEYVDDVTGEGSSNCCGAAVYLFGDDAICKDCKEHCEVVREEDETDRAFSTEQLKEIDAKEKECALAGCDDYGHKCVI